MLCGFSEFERLKRMQAALKGFLATADFFARD
jgi:hypothetical protein